MIAGAGRADDVRAVCLGDLHGEVTDAAGGGMDQHALAGTHSCRVDQCLPRSKPG
jgi:hypothetical protein